MASHASHMLEAALEQMDDIIAGSQTMTEQADILQLAEDLRLALDFQSSVELRSALRKRVPDGTARSLMDWLHTGKTNLCSSVTNESCQECLSRLESEKESLILQVSVLTDQVEAQGEKIRDLESSLDVHRRKLTTAEKLLQQEMIGRTSVESQKLELMEEVSYLKMKLEGTEEDQSCSRNKQKQAEALLKQLCILEDKVNKLECDKSKYERKLRATKTEVGSLQKLLQAKDAEIESLKRQLLSKSSKTRDATGTDEEYEKMRKGMVALLAANEKKDHRIEELTSLLRKYNKIKEIVAVAQADSAQIGSSEEDLSGSMRRKKLHLSDVGVSAFQWPTSSSSVRVSSPSEQKDLSFRNSPLSSVNVSLQNGQWVQPRMLSSSLNELQTESSQKNHDSGCHRCRTLPGRLSQTDGHGNEGESTALHLNLKNQSADGTNEGLDDVTSDLSPVSSGLDSGRQSPVDNTSRLKKFWGRLRRTQSGSLPANDLEPSQFHRGGLRATAGPRLVGAENSSWDKDLPFANWTPEQVCEWLEEVGLSQYRIMASHWVQSGQTLLFAAPHDLEKELGLKHPLHRKKLQLALQSLSSSVTERSSHLDHMWVTRWLDDIGLPQYKDQFTEARVDGRMLQYLTVNDLLFLKVTSQLHHLSIRCAIYVLHANKFDPHCLSRRPGDEIQTFPSEVAKWSNHRVMEWLRSVDLAEYAPNLRGSGVHGGLIILEPRFNSDTLAVLLNIPPQKTLLRRHLATSFSSLIGPHAQRQKMEFLEGSSSAPLTATSKVRPKKVGLPNFGNIRKKKLEESTEYICPVETPAMVMNGDPRCQSPLLDGGRERTEQMTESNISALWPQGLSENIGNLNPVPFHDTLLGQMRECQMDVL